MRKTIYILTIFTFIACQTNKKLLASFDKESKNLVDSLDKFKYVDQAYIGYSGDESDLFNFFNNFQEKLDIEKLVILTRHKNPTVRVYAFWALCRKKYPGFRKILDDHIKDKKTFMFNQGCVGMEEKVNEFYLMLVDPKATVYDDCIKLSEDELKVYKLKIK